MRTLLVWIFAMAAAGWAAPAPPARSDADITAVFRTKLAKSKLAAEGIQIHVQNGVATLTGRTDIVQHKGTATRMAKGAGARDVKNQIQVSEAARKKASERLAAGRASAKKHAPATSAVTAPPPIGATAASRTATPTAAAVNNSAEQAPPPIRRAVIVKH